MGAAVPGYRDVTVETSDGLRLAAGYREAAPGMPTLLFFHGNAGNISHRLDSLALQGPFRMEKSSPAHA